MNVWIRVISAGLLGLNLCLAQGSQISVLQIGIEKVVLYINDVTDFTKLATDPAVTTRQASRNFNLSQFIGDIVTVNGKPARGTWTTKARAWGLSPNPTGGQAIADTTRGWVEDIVWELQQSDGSAVGSIMASGFRQGPMPPGNTLAGGTSSFAITGGTGAFLGVRGQAVFSATVAARAASVTEDPTYRRVHGGGTVQFVLQLIPLARPEVRSILHADLTPVTVSSPARAGEILILAVTNLGPTSPGVDPGTPFAQNPLAIAISPVAVIINGQSVETVNQLGWPGTTDVYRVDFRVPTGISPGTSKLMVSAAWFVGPAVEIPVR